MAGLKMKVAVLLGQWLAAECECNLRKIYHPVLAELAAGRSEFVPFPDIEKLANGLGLWAKIREDAKVKGWSEQMQLEKLVKELTGQIAILRKLRSQLDNQVEKAIRHPD